MLVNSNTHKVIVQKMEKADSFLSRHAGLIGQRSFSGRALIIENCNQVHTFFMRFPIDVLFLDQKQTVVGKTSCLQPWRVSPKIRGASSVIEAEAGSFSDDIVSPGDRITVTEFQNITKINREGSI
ncbi:DUF192 domain-containing protein [Alteribacter natronophilus]|uniref:DUF192 domain-containing protein n=1 Tax=Alteribacter natronophilus TaxID=2583810 RepID=UPI00148661BF|nr:DUF192 domain-containing protein [Alteribacter natronophilus]